VWSSDPNGCAAATRVSGTATSRDGTERAADPPGWRPGVKVDETRGPRLSAEDGGAGSATKLGGLSEDGTFGTDRRLCRRRSQVLQLSVSRSSGLPPRRPVPLLQPAPRA
jgi:hypothetical protein